MTTEEIDNIFPQTYKGTAFISDLRLMVKALNDGGHLGGTTPPYDDSWIQPALDEKLDLSGGTMTGGLSINGGLVTHGGDITTDGVLTTGTSASGNSVIGFNFQASKPEAYLFLDNNDDTFKFEKNSGTFNIITEENFPVAVDPGDTTAADLDELKQDYNTLLANLRAAGLIA